ncbi:putative six-bladed beta-propeller, TolB [Septoria linicola]|nr:putative six-bladed beta-propeller, TolB [Septoria linicola]
MLYYDNIKPPTPTKLYILSIYRATPDVPLDTQSIDDITHRGRVLTLETGKDAEPITLLDNLHMPDGITISQKLVESSGRRWATRLQTTELSLHTPKQIIIDEEAGKLYFCDREGLRVHRCDPDGGGQEILVQTGDWVLNKDHQNEQTRWCVGIAISKKLGKIFWTQKGAPKSKQGRIFSANIDIPAGFTGQNRPDIELVAGDLPEPIDLEFDEDAGALYWTDRGEFPFGNTLNKKTLLGDVPASEQQLGRQILAEGFAEAIGLALDKENECAWVADLAGRVWKCDVRKPAAKQKVFESETSVFTGLAVMHTEASL